MMRMKINDCICTILLLLLLKIVEVGDRNDKGDTKKHRNRKPLNIH